MKVEAAKTHEEAGKLGGRGNKAKENSQGFNGSGSKSPERIIARLKRDAATDTHAAALLGSIEPPSLALLRPLVPSARPTPTDTLPGAWAPQAGPQAARLRGGRHGLGSPWRHHPGPFLASGCQYLQPSPAVGAGVTCHT